MEHENKSYALSCAQTTIYLDTLGSPLPCRLSLGYQSWGPVPLKKYRETLTISPFFLSIVPFKSAHIHIHTGGEKSDLGAPFAPLAAHTLPRST